MRFCRFSANHPAANAKLASTVTLTPGYAATEREREKGFRTPIIFITAYPERVRMPARSMPEPYAVSISLSIVRR